MQQHLGRPGAVVTYDALNIGNANISGARVRIANVVIAIHVTQMAADLVFWRPRRSAGGYNLHDEIKTLSNLAALRL